MAFHAHETLPSSSGTRRAGWHGHEVMAYSFAEEEAEAAAAATRATARRREERRRRDEERARELRERWYNAAPTSGGSEVGASGPALARRRAREHARVEAEQSARAATEGKLRWYKTGARAPAPNALLIARRNARLALRSASERRAAEERAKVDLKRRRRIQVGRVLERARDALERAQPTERPLPVPPPAFKPGPFCNSIESLYPLRPNEVGAPRTFFDRLHA
jgi:hypothetical protein